MKVTNRRTKQEEKGGKNNNMTMRKMKSHPGTLKSRERERERER